MVRHATFLIVLAVLAAGCGGAQKGESPEPPISMDAADKLVPGQAARSVALQTEIRSAGHECSKVVRAFKQGVRDGGDVWDAECEGGQSYGIVSGGDGQTEVLECGVLEQQTGTACWEKF